MSEHVLIVGTGRDFPARFRQARPGVQTSVLVRLESLGKVRDPAANARVIAVRAGAPEREWVTLASAAHAAHPFTRIATVGENEQDRCAAIGAALGLYTHSARTVELAHDKLRMRERLRAVGVEDTPHARAGDAAQIRAFLRAHGGPIVVKPITGAASAGVSVIHAEAQATAAWQRASGEHERIASPGVIVERFHPGEQYSVEAFSEAGEHVVVAITRKFSDPVSLVELGHVTPAPLPDEDRARIQAHTVRVLEALGVEFGPTHTEIALGPDGPRLIETHVRFGGDDIPELALDATGVDMADCLVRQTLGEKVLPGIRALLADGGERGASAIWFAAAPAAGVLQAVSGEDEARAVAGVTSAQVLAKPGAVLAGLDSSDARLAAVRAVGEDPEQALAAAREGVRRLEFLVRASAPDGATI